MNRSFKNSFLLTLLFLCLFEQKAKAQYQDYTYIREVETNNSLWNEILLPMEMFDHLRHDYADIRLYTITNTDTIEEPYLLEILESKKELKRLNYKIINQVKDEQSYYYTFALDSIQNVNEVILNFGVKNFDTRITLYGSDDNSKWYTIKENQRILSILNPSVNYAFTNLTFPTVRYKYLKMEVKGSQDLKLQAPSITYDITRLVGLNRCETESFSIKNDQRNKKTILTWTTKHLSPVSTIQIKLKDDIDYIRSIRMYYATDSTYSSDGMKYHYRELFHGTISSFEPSIYHFSPTILKHLKVEIINDDNQALTIDEIKVQANSIRLKTRISNQGHHQLLYGNQLAHFPRYDIEKFQNKIPKNLTIASLGLESLNPANIKEDSPVIKPVFENKFWLWGLMGLIIVLLGWYTLKMLK